MRPHVNDYPAARTANFAVDSLDPRSAPTDATRDGVVFRLDIEIGDDVKDAIWRDVGRYHRSSFARHGVTPSSNDSIDTPSARAIAAALRELMSPARPPSTFAT